MARADLPDRFLAAERKRGHAVLALTLCAVLGACGSGQVTETPFARVASEAASLLSAGAETLRFVHAEPARFTVEYGLGATINYHELLVAVPEALPRLEGAPDLQAVDRLVALVQPAVADLGHPCLLPDCDWQSQVARIDQARQALLDATE